MHRLVGLVAEMEHGRFHSVRCRLVGEAPHPVQGPVIPAPQAMGAGIVAEHQPQHQPEHGNEEHPEQGGAHRPGGALASQYHEDDGHDGQPELERQDPDARRPQGGRDGDILRTRSSRTSGRSSRQRRRPQRAPCSRWRRMSGFRKDGAGSAGERALPGTARRRRSG